MPPTFGRYSVRRKLGEGGMGAVYLVTAPDGTPFALKTLRAEHSENEEFVKRFLREAGIALRLRHRNIVATHEQAQARDGTLYMVTEFCPHGGLDHLLVARDRINPPEAVFWLAGVAQALEYAWREHHVIHRDIKPANLLFDGDWNIKLADLGLALRAEANATRLTMEGTIVGSVSYMSPEQALAGELDARSDLYALGATFYHLLCGEPVFVGSTVAHVIKMHVKQPPERLSARCPGIHAALVNLIHRLLEKDPDARPANAAVLREEITAVAAEMGVALDRIPESAVADLRASRVTPSGSAGTDGPGHPQGGRAASLDQHTLALHKEPDFTVVAQVSGSVIERVPASAAPLGPSALFRLAARAEDPAPQEPRACLRIVPVDSTTGIDVVVFATPSVQLGRAIGEGVDLPIRVYPVADNKAQCMRISSLHARIAAQTGDALAGSSTGLAGAWTVTDLASNNGVLIGSQRLPAGTAAPILDNTVIDIAGAVRLRARRVGEATPPILTLDGALFEPNPLPALVLTREQNRSELVCALIRDRLMIGGLAEPPLAASAGPRAFTAEGTPVNLRNACGALWWRDGRFWWQPAGVTSIHGQSVQPDQLAPLSSRSAGTTWRAGGMQFTFRAFSFDLFR